MNTVTQPIDDFLESVQIISKGQDWSAAHPVSPFTSKPYEVLVSVCTHSVKLHTTHVS